MPARRKHEIPFDGDPPPVKAGDRVRYVDALGRWFTSTARSAPRYDHKAAIGWQVPLTVALDWGDDPTMVVNWTAEHVFPLEDL